MIHFSHIKKSLYIRDKCTIQKLSNALCNAVFLVRQPLCSIAQYCTAHQRGFENSVNCFGWPGLCVLSETDLYLQVLNLNIQAWPAGGFKSHACWPLKHAGEQSRGTWPVGHSRACHWRMLHGLRWQGCLVGVWFVHVRRNLHSWLCSVLISTFRHWAQRGFSWADHMGMRV